MFSTTSIVAFIASLSLLGLADASPLVKRATDRAPSYVTCKNPKQVAITFDDGVYEYEASVAQYLKGQNVTATFFVNGNNWACIYDANSVKMLQAIIANGHQLASHSWSHPDMTTLSDTQVRQQLDLVETATKKIVGVVPKFFRFPYGAKNDHLLEIAKEYKYETVLWNFDTEDADGATVSYSEGVYDDVAASYPNPAIVLNHSPYKTTTNTVIPYAIKKLKAKGYEFVDVATCTGYQKSQWYKSTTTPGTRDSTWTCSGTPSGK
ncbi:carbohydrate esterase family 4 protein [Atractiella rhizophila]|nr:carbohydrate esterase family 4 protein [Atractiella rhizophila]